MSNIIDVINTEEDIGHIITDKCNIKHIAILSGVSKLFNRIVKNDMEKQRNKYIKRQILRKIDVIITNKMYSMIKNQGGRGIYKTLEEYDADLRELATKIYTDIYDDIITELNTIHGEYIFDGSITNSCYEAYLFGIMENEYIKLIEYLKKILSYLRYSSYKDCNINNITMLIPTIFSTFPECIPKKGILHIGAHMCEEKALYNTINIGDNDILWVEAISEIVEYVKKINENINIIQAVITDTDDEYLDFMITNNKESSSIFNFGTHAIEHPHVFEIERRQLKSITLNTLFERNNISYDRYDFINIDIQGAELKAFKGATHILPHIKAIYAEVNEKMLYEGAGLLPELDEYLATFNFKRVITNMTRHGWGDALYIKHYVKPIINTNDIYSMNYMNYMNYMNTPDN